MSICAVGFHLHAQIYLWNLFLKVLKCSLSAHNILTKYMNFAYVQVRTEPRIQSNAVLKITDAYFRTTVHYPTPSISISHKTSNVLRDISLVKWRKFREQYVAVLSYFPYLKKKKKKAYEITMLPVCVCHPLNLEPNGWFSQKSLWR